MATIYVLVYTTNPQILTVTCCIHRPTHPMSKIPFSILNFLDSDVCAVMTLIFLTSLKKCASFSKNVTILLLLLKRPITAFKKLIDSRHYKKTCELAIDFNCFHHEIHQISFIINLKFKSQKQHSFGTTSAHAGSLLDFAALHTATPWS